MARIALLPFDISISTLLRYISPKDFDTFCLCDDRFENWSRDPKNIRYYLTLCNGRFPLDDVDHGLNWSIYYNSKILIDHFFASGAKNYNDALRWAARYGNMSIFKRMLDLGAKSDHWLLCLAVEGGNVEIVNLALNFRDHDVCDLNEALSMAAEKGHVELVGRMIELGANDLDTAMAESRNLDMVRLMMNYGANDYLGTAMRAAERGHVDIVNYMLNFETGDYDLILESSARGNQPGNIEIAKLMVALGASSYNSTMVEASISGNIDIVRLMLSHGAYDYDKSLTYAVHGRNIEIVKLMLAHGARNYDKAIAHAKVMKSDQIVELLEKVKEHGIDSVGL